MTLIRCLVQPVVLAMVLYEAGWATALMGLVIFAALEIVYARLRYLSGVPAATIVATIKHKDF